MKALLWKEYRLNRKMLCILGVFLLLPYVITCICGTAERLRGPDRFGSAQMTAWADLFGASSAWSLILLVVTCGFTSGNAVAGERADRSAEFAAYLPISRRSAISSKAILAIGVCLVALLVNGFIAWVTRGEGLFWFSSGKPADDLLVIWGFGATGILIFGTSWLLSTLLNSAGIAAASGIGAAILVGGTLLFVDYTRGSEEPELFIAAYPWLAIVLGIGCFVAGVVYYLRRVEP